MSALKTSNRNVLPFRPREKGSPTNADVELWNEDPPSESGETTAGLHLEIIKRGVLLAEIIQDRYVPALFHCIVQRSTEVLFWGQYLTQRHAAEAAEDQLTYLSRSEDAA